MANLITLARAKFALNNRVTTANEDATLNALIAAASNSLQRYTRRDFVSASYTEIKSGTGKKAIRLDHPPIISIKDVRIGLETAIKIKQSNKTTNQFATIRTLTTGVTLLRMASAVETENAVTWGTNPKVGDVATAINTVANGWSATATSTYTNWPSDQLYAFQGPLDAWGIDAELKLHSGFISDFAVLKERGELIRSAHRTEIDAESVWTVGRDNIKVVYTGGFATVPEDVQEGCAILVASWFFQTKRDPMLSMERTADYTYTAHPIFHKPFPDTVRRLIDPYKLWKV